MTSCLDQPAEKMTRLLHNLLYVWSSVQSGQGNDETAPCKKNMNEDNESLSLPVKAPTNEEEEINEKAANIARPKMAVFMFILTAVRLVQHLI